MHFFSCLKLHSIEQRLKLLVGLVPSYPGFLNLNEKMDASGDNLEFLLKSIAEK